MCNGEGHQARLACWQEQSEGFAAGTGRRLSGNAQVGDRGRQAENEQAMGHTDSGQALRNALANRASMLVTLKTLWDLKVDPFSTYFFIKQAPFLNSVHGAYELSAAGQTDVSISLSRCGH